MKKIINDDPEFKVYLCEKDAPTDLRDWDNIYLQLKPIACFIKPDGTIKNTPSLVFLMESEYGMIRYFAQISAEMLKPALDYLNCLHKT